MSTQVQIAKVNNDIYLGIYRGINTIDQSLIDKVTRSSPSRLCHRHSLTKLSGLFSLNFAWT